MVRRPHLLRRRAIGAATLATVFALCASAALCGSAAAATEDPGPVPPKCSVTDASDGLVAGGCLEVGAAPFSVGPRVVHVGQPVTGSVMRHQADDTWNWKLFVSEVGGGRHLSGCGDNAPSCTVRASRQAVSNIWETFGERVGIDFLGGRSSSISSDYFIVNNDLDELSGRVFFSDGVKRTPASDVAVRVTGKRRKTTRTNAKGVYSFVLPKGHYRVRLGGRDSQPPERTVKLNRDVGGVNFLTGCVGEPTLKIKRRREGRDTLIDVKGANWDVKDCGAVTVTAAAEKHSAGNRVFDTSDFTFQFRVTGRRPCGAEFFAQQASGRERKASYSLGDPVPVQVVFADPGLTTHGEQLFPGDVLCKDEVPAGARAMIANGQFGPPVVEQIASENAQNLLELQDRNGQIFMSDMVGLTSVTGDSAEFAGSQVQEIEAGFGDTNPAELGSSSSGDEQVSGFARARHGLTVSGNLNLNHGVLFVDGDLSVSGTITGVGAVFATGNIKAGGASLITDDQYGLVAGGRLDLP